MGAIIKTVRCFVVVFCVGATLFSVMETYGAEDSRYALVIGNSGYRYMGHLNNPTNDARDMAAALDGLGFKVTRLINASNREMERAVWRFGQQIENGGVGLFYYAGHGVQVNGRNYLLPVDARVESESDIRFESLDVGRVLGKMADAGNRLNIVILDACRDNPFARSFRSVESGLARMNAPKGAIIAYATAPGMKAADGDGRNGVFTRYLLRHIRTPGIQVEEVLKRVRMDVMAETNEGQVPWESSSLTGYFYFAGSGAVHEMAPVRPPKNAYAKLLVETNVATAVVFLDGKRKGVGSLDIERVEPGVHRLKATADGHDPYEGTVRLKKGVNRVSVQLEKTTYKEKIEKNARGQFTNSLGMTFVYIQPVEFLMGSPHDESERNENERQHRVRLT